MGEPSKMPTGSHHPSPARDGRLRCDGSSCYSSDQSTGSAPMDKSAWLALEKGREPKKP